jgi:hypothetical protein
MFSELSARAHGESGSDAAALRAAAGEPFDLARHVGQPVKLGGGQQPVADRISIGNCSLMAAASRRYPVARRRAGVPGETRPRAGRDPRRLGRKRSGAAGRAHSERRLPRPVIGHRAFDGEHRRS